MCIVSGLGGGGNNKVPLLIEFDTTLRTKCKIFTEYFSVDGNKTAVVSDVCLTKANLINFANGAAVTTVMNGSLCEITVVADCSAVSFYKEVIVSGVSYRVDIRGYPTSRVVPVFKVTCGADKPSFSYAFSNSTPSFDPATSQLEFTALDNKKFGC